MRYLWAGKCTRRSRRIPPHDPSSGSCPVLSSKRHLVVSPARQRSQAPQESVTLHATLSPSFSSFLAASVVPSGSISTNVPTASCPKMDGQAPKRRPDTVWISAPHMVARSIRATAWPAASSEFSSSRDSEVEPPSQSCARKV